MVAGAAMLLLVAILSAPVQAAINPQINFQGKLTNPDGTNVTDGTYSIRFRIYNHASNDAASACAANSCLWEETQGSVSVTSGIFGVTLGSSTALPGSVDFNVSGLYLGVKVGADAEMTPRITFTAAPYAFNSDKVGGIASSGFVQLGQSASAQVDNSNNASMFVNKNTGTGNILQLQKTASDVFVISNAGNITATGTYNTNTFSSSALQFGAAGTATVQSAASQALTLTGHANSTWSTDAGTVTVQGFAGTTLNSAARGTASTNSGAVAIASGNATGTTSTAGNVTIDVGTSTTGQGAIQIGTAARAQTITVGNATAGTTLALTAANGISLNNSVSVAAGQNITFTAGAGGFNQSSSTGTFQSGTGAVSLNGATTVSSTTNGAVALTSTFAPGLSSGAVTMTAVNGAMTFTTSSAITITAGDFVVPTTSTAQARMIAIGGSGTSFTVSSRFAANVTAETFTIYRPVNIINSSANSVGVRINTAGSNTDALQIYSAVTSEVTAAFKNGGDLVLGSSSVSGSVATPDVSAAATASQSMDILTGNSLTSGATGAITIQSGNATSGTSGAVGIDNGTSSTGTPTINLGVTNSRAINLGNTNAATVVAVSVGAANGSFKIQGASSAIYMQLDTSANNRLHVGNPTADATAFLLVLDSKNTAGDPTNGTNGGMYYNSANNRFRCYENGVWVSCTGGPDASAKRVSIYDDFVKNSTTTNTIGSLGWSVTLTGTATNSANNAAADADHIGLHRCTSSTTNPSGCLLNLGNTQTRIWGGERWGAVVRTPSNLTATNLYVGLGDATTGTNSSTDAVQLRKISGTANWQGEVLTNTASTTCDTGIVAVASNYVQVQAVVNAGATAVDFYLNGATTPSCTVTAALPTASGRELGPIFQFRNADTTNNKTGEIDAYWFERVTGNRWQ